MALVDTLNSLTTAKTLKPVINQVFNETPFLRELQKRQVPYDGGLEVRELLRYKEDTSNRSWYSGDDVWSITKNDDITYAYYKRKNARYSIQITGDDIDDNAGDSQILSILSQKMAGARPNMASMLTTVFFGDGTGTKEPLGIKAICDDGTNSYGQTVGGIDCTTYTWWKGKRTAVSDYISWGVMQDMYGSLTDGQDRPQLIMTTQAVWDDLWEDLTPTVRTQMGEYSAKFGFRAIEFNGTPIVVDKACPAGFMFFLNFDYLHLRPRRGYQSWKWSGWKEPENQEVQVGHFIWKGALTCSARYRQGELVSITT